MAPVDPFQGQPILSLHPNRFPHSKASLKSNDLQAIHHHISSIAQQNLDKHFEEAKSIIEGGSELLNTQDNFEPNMKENENPQKNRPALARKRAKFSMKPDTSQPSTIVEPTFKMDQLLDPEDVFAAYEKFENTKKELKRQRGEDPNEPKISTTTTTRQRRPEIPRRKISYQHHVYSSQPENDTLLSQETLHDTTETQPIQDTQQSVTSNCQSNEKEVTGSITKAEDRVNKLFDDLMSSNIADLDGNETLSYLEDRLNIKHVAINDLHLPDFHDNPTVNILSSVNFLKNQHMLPDTRFLSDNLKENTIEKQKKLPDKPFDCISSPIPSKSPLQGISAFGKIISKSHATESNDPFLPRDMDMFPATATSEIISRPSTHASKDTEFPVSSSEDNELPVSASVEDLSDCEQHNMKETDVDMQKNVEDATEKVVSSSPLKENVDITTIGEPENNCFHSAQTDDSSVNVPVSSLPVQNPDVHEQHNKERPKKMNSRKWTRETCKVDPKKKRHSLAGGGSGWTNGVRKSKRIRSKPLEYWKGERLLYARVHNSLPTVVGRKYISPTATKSKGKPGFKVESFVSDEYKDLVDLISLH
ncbi:centromere protein C-like [Bidens hawaiensis]|uniref:centromere protein C-like n=1 Tax=Bidens hawaiensis TaxID=980011 RepID=UPI00404AA382